ncbi:MAG: cupin domain-containing protein [Terriglobales bacterium]
MKKASTRSRTTSKSRSAKKSAGPAASIALKGTVAKRRPKGKLSHTSWNSIPIEALNAQLGRQLIVGQDLMLARVLLKKGCIVPEHSHPNEQLTYILEGALKFWIDGEEIVVRPGEVLTIPPNMPHKAEAVEDTVDIDIFYPPRADWMGGTDNYLR